MIFDTGLKSHFLIALLKLIHLGSEALASPIKAVKLYLNNISLYLQAKKLSLKISINGLSETQVILALILII